MLEIPSSVTSEEVARSADILSKLVDIVGFFTIEGLRHLDKNFAAAFGQAIDEWDEPWNELLHRDEWYGSRGQAMRAVIDAHVGLAAFAVEQAVAIERIHQARDRMVTEFDGSRAGIEHTTTPSPE
jgi:hypothetical protein